MRFAARCFQAPKLGLLFPPFSLGPPLAKSQKMADLGAFAICVITRLCGHFCGRSLRQNVVRSLPFKCKLMSRSCDLQQGVFKPLSSASFFRHFPLVPP